MNIEPRRALSRANLIMALLCGGEIKKARQEWQAGKHLLHTVPNFKLLEMLMHAYSSDDPVPESRNIQIAQHLQEAMGTKAIMPLIEKAWRWRRSAEPENAFGVREAIGILAGRAGRGELALEAWREIKTFPGGAAYTLNEAVELSNLGRHAEALALIDATPRQGNRAWTVTGNIRARAGMHAAAIDAYRSALDHEEDFLLPLQNAVSSAAELGAPDLLDPFCQTAPRRPLGGQPWCRLGSRARSPAPRSAVSSRRYPPKRALPRRRHSAARSHRKRPAGRRQCEYR